VCKRTLQSATVYLGLGSNIDPVRNLVEAVSELRRRYGALSISPVYESAAVGFDGDDFLNLVVGLQSDQTAAQICETIEAIHNLAGRERGSDKWASRPLDIDLLLYNDLIEDRRPVRVPRSDVLEYSFVLRPLAELVPDLRHPVTGRTMLQHWQEFDQESHPLLPVDVDLSED
jgi:2-amino-4-hydroxy-6-hydroxymethyldihydropteridine diphosphokinase